MSPSRKAWVRLVLPCSLQYYPCNFLEDDKLATIDRLNLAAEMSANLPNTAIFPWASEKVSGRFL